MLERTVDYDLTVSTTIGLSSIPVMFRLGKNVNTESQSAGNQRRIPNRKGALGISSLVGSSETTRITTHSNEFNQ